MPYRYYEATHHELDPKLREYTRLEWAETMPVMGESALLGSARPWEIVAVDEFRLAEQTQPEFEADTVVFLNHCALKAEKLPERSVWARVEMFQENPLTILQLFVSQEGKLIQSSMHLYGKRAKVGAYLKQYNYEKRQFKNLPWRVSRLDTYLPSAAQNPYYCYGAICIGYCVQVPQVEVKYQPGSQPYSATLVTR